MAMQPSSSTESLLASLDAFSGNKLTRRTDLGLLLETAFQHRQESLLHELSFLAKFVSKAYGIMTRIGKDGEGYESVAIEFSRNLEKATALTRTLIEKAPSHLQEEFATTYFAMTSASLQNLLDLFYDLGWYKNWLIDHPHEDQ